MTVYIRRIATNHDIKKEISIEKETYENFFGKKKEFIFINKHDTEKNNYEIKITFKDEGKESDPRLGGNFKKLLRKNTNFSIGDIVIIYKTKDSIDNKDVYEIEVLEKENQLNQAVTKFYTLGDEIRHLNVSIEKTNNEQRFIEWISKGGNKGRMYQQETIDAYTTVLKRTINENITYFDIDDEEIINESYKIISASQKDNKGHNRDSSAILAYYNFLRDKNNINLDYKQIIFYGVPGCGKSNSVMKMTEQIDSSHKMRIVFHPEYTNADFVGQIVPIQDEEGIDYRFKAGPFTQILKKALLDPHNPYFLVIEEINRGNAASIFGDIFQLLDRDEDGKSTYGIKNIDINAFIRTNGTDIYVSKKSELEESVTINNEEFTSESDIYLPKNISILATMNTSDQNVFVLDNAFQRRWTMRHIKNEFNMSDKEHVKQAEAKIEGFDTITWGAFLNKINFIISNKSNTVGISSMEDKRLGCWFIRPDIHLGNIISKDLFSDKVLKYLWDDAFKFTRKDIFKNEFESFESICEAFKKNKNIFIDETILGTTGIMDNNE